jgi:hypothetical protein
MVRLKREMAGIEQVDLGIWIVAGVRMSARRDKEWIVFPPDREQGRTMLSEIRLKVGIERNVGPVDRCATATPSGRPAWKPNHEPARNAAGYSLSGEA